jgi:hypothetical protein
MVDCLSGDVELWDYPAMLDAMYYANGGILYNTRALCNDNTLETPDPIPSLSKYLD